jgi:antitoxin PrlF
MRVTAKGQVTIPQKIRQKMNIGPASEVNFVVGEDGRIYLEKVADSPEPDRFTKLRGIATVKMSTEEIMALTRGD